MCLPFSKVNSDKFIIFIINILKNKEKLFTALVCTALSHQNVFFFLVKYFQICIQSIDDVKKYILHLW